MRKAIGTTAGLAILFALAAVWYSQNMRPEPEMGFVPANSKSFALPPGSTLTYELPPGRLQVQVTAELPVTLSGAAAETRTLRTTRTLTQGTATRLAITDVRSEAAEVTNAALAALTLNREAIDRATRSNRIDVTISTWTCTANCR